MLTIGRARRTHYAARRPLPGYEQPLPVFQFDEEGGYDLVANLTLAHPHGSVLEWSGNCLSPLDEEMQDG